jgi:AcrR family transcriptional regulator
VIIFAIKHFIGMRENNKEKLFAQTFSLLLTHNIGDLTLDEVEKATGFTRGAIFYYAKTKPDIFRLAMEVGLFDRMRNEEELDAFVSQPKTLAEFITFYAEWLEQPIKIIMEAK